MSGFFVGHCTSTFIGRKNMHVATSLRYTAAAAVLALAACGKDSTGPAPVTDPGSGTPVEFNGTLAGSAITGDISITIAGSASARVVAGGIEFNVSGSRAVVAVNGCLYLGSATCTTITGTYNTTSKALNFTTASPAFTFTGTYTNGTVAGTFTGAGGSGVFVVHSGTVQVFCGVYTGDSDGIWNLVKTGSTLLGVYYDVGGTSGQLTGSVSGSAITITFPGGSAGGTISGTSMSGTWQTLAGDAGTWTGQTGGCRG